MIDQDIKKLDEIAKKMENPELGLEENLENFQKGIELIKKCLKGIEEAELKVKEIIEKNPSNFESIEIKS